MTKKEVKPSVVIASIVSIVLTLLTASIYIALLHFQISFFNMPVWLMTLAVLIFITLFLLVFAKFSISIDKFTSLFVLKYIKQPQRIKLATLFFMVLVAYHITPVFDKILAGDKISIWSVLFALFLSILTWSIFTPDSFLQKDKDIKEGLKILHNYDFDKNENK